MTDLEPRRTATPALAGVAEIALDDVVRWALPPAVLGDRYHPWNLTKVWLAEVAGRNSEHTMRSYGTALAQWLDYCLRSRLDPLQARRVDVDDWITHHRGRSPATVIARLAAITSWYRYLIDNKIDVDNPAAGITRPKRAPSDTEYLGQDELRAFLAAADARLETTRERRGLALEVAARDVAVLRILATTGVRSGAVQLATVADVRALRDGQRILRYRGKGDGGRRSTRHKPLVPDAVAAVDYYFGLVAERLNVSLDQLLSTDTAFRTTPYNGRPGNRQLRTDALINMIQTTASDAGIASADKLTPHSLRHTVATVLGKQADLAQVQDFMDHGDPRTTRIYLHTDQALVDSLTFTMAALIHRSSSR
ncbi:MAG TPA: tyrosine-type recombinase/integrase [Pseudonocardiaceae bacterium]|jgi:site-specific recombinase XerD